MDKRRGWGVLYLLGTVGLTGCFSTVRRVQKVDIQPPGAYKTASVKALSEALSARDAAVETLDASVLVKASTGGEKTGKVKTYTSFRGWIYVQKPRQLRVLLQLPFVGTRAMDMVSDGSSFTLLIPPHNVAYLGTNEVTKPSQNGLENLRPRVFLDSLLVPGLADDEVVTRIESTREVEAGHGHHDAVDEPVYELLVQKAQGDKTLRPERAVHISRVTLLPYEQDVYDEQGQVVTRAVYDKYQPTGPQGLMLPYTVIISRPLDQYSLEIDVTKLTLNKTFDADQFVKPKIPTGFKVVQME